MSQYIYDQQDWPQFRWDAGLLSQRLAGVRFQQGRLLGQLESLGFAVRDETTLGVLTEDALRTSDIEGEHLDAAQVRSSVARRLGMDAGGLQTVDRRVEGVVEVVVDATQRYREPLTADRLRGWHASLFPTGRSGMRRITVGAWRTDETGPMQVVSGRTGRERVHFEAPSADKLEREMQAFLEWFEGDPKIDGILQAGIAHLWLVTVHPFDDGNGRIARAVADMALARCEGTAQRAYSMSAQIRLEREAYYTILERTQKGTMDVTPWLDWFIECLGRAISGAQDTLSRTIHRARFWDAAGPVNERQRRVLNLLLGEFEGKLTTSKWARIAKCSKDTALRDIRDLLERGILVRGPGGGRSVSYELGQPVD
ncbi:MAG: Fic family protein [Armatimonadetes bacterium]|nr:Fic family protein [Armatimonadota bacterium]